MTKKNIVLLLVVFIPIALLLYYFFGDTMKSVKGDPWRLVPDAAALVIELDKPAESFAKWQNDNAMGESFKSLHEAVQLAEDLRQLDSLFAGNHSFLKLIQNSQLLVAVTYDTAVQKPRMVLVSHVQQYINLNDFKHYISKELGSSYAVIDTEIAGVYVLKILNGISNKMICLGYSEGNLVLSFGIEGITNALRDAGKGKKSFFGSRRLEIT